jgi:acetyl-CoA carboxylase biotin carboxylase subunit
MFKRIFIANRGEIALRILRTCHDMGIEAFVGYSEADKDSLPVRLADRAICIGPGPAGRSYLNVPNVLSAALISGCDALHPGYGFLSENAFFADACASSGITFIGPSPEAMEKLADKAQARTLVAQAGVPVMPGSEQPLRGLEEARKMARDLGYPIVLKAAAGGGGRGIRLVQNEAELATLLPVAESEAATSFGRGDLYVEKFMSRARHVEVQVVGLPGGQVIALGDRDCSTQRRRQKIVEEAPAPGLTEGMRRALHKAAVRAAEAVGYSNVGTVEFLLGPDGDFYFLEVNARIQVEHPTTEMVFGIDLVRAQIEVAAGVRPVSLLEAQPRGHAIEVRVCAEDVSAGCKPMAGKVETVHWPAGPGIRVDSHLDTGAMVPPFYDSLMGKVVAWGCDRGEALARLRRALRETQVVGLHSNVELLRHIITSEEFVSGRLDIHWLEGNWDRLVGSV